MSGILVGPTAERAGLLCPPDARWDVAKPGDEKESVLEIVPAYLPPGGHVLDAPLDEFGIMRCDGQLASSALSVGIAAADDAGARILAGESWFAVPHGGTIDVHKRLFAPGSTPAEPTDIPASHWYADKVAGLPAAIGRPVVDAGLGGGAVIIWDAELRVLTTVYSYNLSLSELSKFAEGVAR